MAYTAPTPAEFKARHAVFASVADATVQAVLDESARSVDDGWIEADRARAVMLLTAHVLVSEGALASAQSGGAGSYVANGGVTSMSLGDGSVSFGKSASSSSAGGDAWLQSTTYGQQFMRLRRVNRGGPVVV